MFGISIGELFIVLLVALAIIRPNDMSVLAKNYRAFMKNFTGIKSQITDSVSQIHNQLIDIGAEDKLEEKPEADNYHYILDSDGKLQKAYNINSETKVS